jgi:DNA-binding GntR family transcriptional regulator
VGGRYRDQVQLDEGSAVPFYEQLAAILREQIRSGKLTGRLPAARDLAVEYQVSHATSERSLRILRDEGLVESLIGKGWFVKR